MDYQKSYRLYRLCLYLGIALMLLFLLVRALWMCAAGVAIVFLGLIQAAVFYRCPGCGASLNYRDRMPKYCPQCGKRLAPGPGPR